MLSLFFDGILALKEKFINHEVHFKEAELEYDVSRLSWDYMFNFNLYSMIFTIIGLSN